MLTRLLVIVALGFAVAFGAEQLSAQAVQTTHVFNLHPSNSQPVAIAVSASRVYVSDSGGRKVFVYDHSGNRQASEEFSISRTITSGNYASGFGISLHSTNLYVVFGNSYGGRLYPYSLPAGSPGAGLNSFTNVARGLVRTDTNIYIAYASGVPNQIRTYNTSGTENASARLNLHTDNGSAQGLARSTDRWFVADSADHRIYVYTHAGALQLAEGIITSQDPQGLDIQGNKLWIVTSGTTDTVETYNLVDESVPAYTTFSSTAFATGSWKCIRNSGGQTFTISNASVRLHGLCARPDGSSGMAIELHIATSNDWPDLERFVSVTDRWRFSEGTDIIFDDAPSTTNSRTAFAETAGGLESSTRLGFGTLAKSVTESDCAETNGVGFTCNRSNLASLGTGDTGALGFYLAPEQTVAGADTPAAPAQLQIARTGDYTGADVTWALYDAVALYQIERETIVESQSGGDPSYTDTVTREVGGTQAGVSSYTDSGLEFEKGYRYRMRARGASTSAWSGWSSYSTTAAREKIDIDAPDNIELTRGEDSVTISWTAPPGSLDGYTVQRQELSISEGSTFFSNIRTVSGEDWLSSSTTTFTDSSILPDHTYEYRVAAVKGDEVGTYSVWYRTTVELTSLGDAPTSFRLLEDRDRLLDDRYEFWMGWDEVPGADDYEIEIRTYRAGFGDPTSARYILRDDTYFHTSHERVRLRLRARKLDPNLCSTADDNRCVTTWTGWYEVGFTAPARTEIDAPPTPVPADVDIREDVETAIEETLNPAGATVDGGLVLQFGTLVVAMVVAGAAYAISHKRDLKPLGAGMATAIFILILFAGYRVFGIPGAWPIVFQVLVAALGVVALVRQLGVLR